MITCRVTDTQTFTLRTSQMKNILNFSCRVIPAIDFFLSKEYYIPDRIPLSFRGFCGMWLFNLNLHGKCGVKYAPVAIDILYESYRHWWLHLTHSWFFPSNCHKIRYEIWKVHSIQTVTYLKVKIALYSTECSQWWNRNLLQICSCGIFAAVLQCIRNFSVCSL